jgi:hypothetical protein
MKYKFDDCTIVVMYDKLDTFDKKNVHTYALKIPTTVGGQNGCHNKYIYLSNYFYYVSYISTSVLLEHLFIHVV